MYENSDSKHSAFITTCIITKHAMLSHAKLTWTKWNINAQLINVNFYFPVLKQKFPTISANSVNISLQDYSAVFWHGKRQLSLKLVEIPKQREWFQKQWKHSLLLDPLSQPETGIIIDKTINFLPEVGAINIIYKLLEFEIFFEKLNTNTLLPQLCTTFM